MQSNRLCIYSFYDKYGVVEKYVMYQIEKLRKHFSWILFVVNGNLSDESKGKVCTLVNEIYENDYKGNDIGAYKAAIDYIGWDRIEKYDEMVVMNSSCFGPIYPLDDAFNWAEEGNYDLWGFSWDKKASLIGTKDYLHSSNNPYYIQSYFICFRKSLLGSDLLRKFYSEIPKECSYAEACSYYSYSFPGYFEDHGYRGGVFCDYDDYNNPLLSNPALLLDKHKMPFFMKRSFFHCYTDVLRNTSGEATKLLIEYVENKTDYPMDIVWDSVLKSCNLADVVRCAQLNRILPKNVDSCEWTKDKLKVGFVFHAYYVDLFDENVSYVNNFPQNTGILFTTDTQEKRTLLEKKLNQAGREAKVIVIGNRGRDVSSLLIGAADFAFDYDLICFSHDKKSSHVKPESVGRSWAYKINENMYGSAEYVRNVIRLFEKEKRLGIAFPSYPNHGDFEDFVNTGWTENFNNTKDLLNRFNVGVEIDEKALCVAPLGTCFWFRPKALKKLFDGYEKKGWSYEDFPHEPNKIDTTILHAIERAYAYFAQDAGYYPVFIYSDEWAAVEVTNLEFLRSSSEGMRKALDQKYTEYVGNGLMYYDENNKENRSVDDQEEFVGILDSLNLLSNAVKVRHYRLWKLLAPFRYIGHKYFQTKYGK